MQFEDCEDDIFTPPKASDQSYQFDLSDVPGSVKIYHLLSSGARNHVGTIGFREIETDNISVQLLLITELDVDTSHRRLGLASEAIRRVAECDYTVTAQRPTVPAQEDGSHLIDVGPAFARALVDKGTISWY